MLKISDEYLYGFTDAEGCFYVGIVPAKQIKLKWQVIPFFKISQNPKGKIVLEQFKSRLHCGYIKRNDTENSKDNSLAFVVRDLKNLTKFVVPFLEGKLTIKSVELAKFKKILSLMLLKKHLTKTGLIEIIDIAYSMNTTKRKVPKKILLKHIG